MNGIVRSLFVGVLLVMMFSLLACGGGGAGSTPAEEPIGDPVAGQELYLGEGACGTCHTIEGLEGANGQVGPDHTNLGSRAEELADDAGVESAEAFIRQSIVEPDAYVAEECPTGPCQPGVMPQDFGERFSEEQIDNLVAFLMQQR